MLCLAITEVLPRLREALMRRTCAHTTLSAFYNSAEGWVQSVLTKPPHRAFFDNVPEWWSMQHQKNYNERYSIRNGCVKSGSLMNVRILKRLSSKTEAVLRSNAYFIKYNLTLISNPWSLYATLKFFKQQELSKCPLCTIKRNVT